MAALPTSATSFFIDMASRSWIELLSAYGVELSESRHRWEVQTDELMFFGIIGFGGKGVRGTCLVGAERTLVEASCRVRSRPRDWIAELANQLVGRMKMKLIGYGVSVTMTTPLALSGVKVTPLPRSDADPVSFGSQSGAALLWLEVETDDDLVLSPSRPLSVEPGGLVF